jgi:hypothetical protein
MPQIHSRPLAGSGLVGCIAQREQGLVAWVQGIGEAPFSEPPPCASRAVPSGFDVEQALTALDYWPAWTIVRAAGAELGSRIAVIGQDGSVRMVLDVCRIHGCAWTAASVEVSGAGRADYDLGPPPFEAAAIRRAMPAEPDSVVVLGDASSVLPVALEICQSGGTVVAASIDPHAPPVSLDLYRSVHKRGLSLVSLTVSWDSPEAEDSWIEIARAVPHLLRERHSVERVPAPAARGPA